MNQFIDLGDDLLEPLHHLSTIDLQFIDQSIDLVDEKNRTHLLLQSLTNNCLGLRHCTFHRTSEDDTTVNCAHRSCDVTTEIDVTGSINEIDEIIFAADIVNHRGARGVDGDSTSALLLIEIENT